MVNDRHENFEDDESEYQFSDDQINYDVESESETKTADIEPAQKKNFLTKLTPYRRMIIGIIVFVVVLIIIYFVLSPGARTTPPPTEFNPNSAANPIAPISSTQQPVVPADKTSATATTQSSLDTLPTPTPPAAMTTTQAPAVPSPVPDVAITATMPTPSGAPAAAMPSQPSPPAPPLQGSPQPPVPVQPPVNSNPAVANMPGQTAPMNPPPETVQPAVGQPAMNQPAMNQPAPAMPMPSANEVTNKLTVLENQNASMMNAMQAQLTQKVAETEMQNKLLQDKVLELNKRLANMEAALNKMAQIVRDGGGVTRVRVPAPRPSEPKMIYTVQAIIPGRAWLKSEAGDTVTVAEGDLLKEYGRVIKIDPYDGVVQIDNGSRIISLSYGTSGE